jgi:hypothetical protein
MQGYGQVHEEGRSQMKKGLYANIHAKRKAGKPMRKAGQKGAPTKQDFINAKKTAKKK